jgi:hypothetical protein
MGTDIHLYVEKQRKDGTWVRAKLSEWECPWCKGAGHYENRPNDKCYWCEGVGKTAKEYHQRNYDVFAMLADVRNDGFVPLAEPRGLPDDLSLTLRTENYDPDDKDAPWLGDHSFSHATLAELLAYNYDRVTKHRGVVDSVQFIKFMEAGGKKAPESYCGGVSGPNVEHVDNKNMMKLLMTGAAPREAKPGADPWDLAVAADGKSYFTTVQWQETYRESAGEAWFNFLDALKKVGEPGKVRVVFGFDS